MRADPRPGLPGRRPDHLARRRRSRAAYATGRGSLKVRARWKIEDLARGQWQLVVTELPPSTSAQKVLEEIEELTNPKIKLGKKALTPEQLQTEADACSRVLDTVRDESSKDAPVRLVFEPKSSRIDQTEFVNTLLAHTSLEVERADQPDDDRHRRPADARRACARSSHEWIGFRFTTVDAPHAASSGQGRRPHPHPRRPA